MIDIINYGVGNIRSIENAFRDVSDSVRICNQVDEIRESAKVVLPGVGAFGPGIAKLRERGWEIEVIKYYREHRPVLGICLGLQLLQKQSLENGTHAGLQIFNSEVHGFKELNQKVSVPNIGWRKITNNSASTLLSDINESDAFYFLHSYYCEINKETTISTSFHGVEFASIDKKGSFVGVQFHPEKSSKSGFKFISNFINWNPSQDD